MRLAVVPVLLVLAGCASRDTEVVLLPASLPPSASAASGQGADCAAGEAPAPLPDRPPAPAAPADDGTTNHVHLRVASDCRTVRVGQVVHLRFTATGDRATPALSGYRLDGVTAAGSGACAPTGPDEQAAPGVVVQDLEHVYRAAGPDRVVVDASTGCSRFSGSDRAEMTIDVRP